MKVVISSGHGKYIRGASGDPVPPYMDEVDTVREIVEDVAAYLRGADVDVVTLHDNVSTTQSANLDWIVDHHNDYPQAGRLDVSVHMNAYEQTSTKPMGVECLYVTQAELAEEVSLAIADAGDFIDRGPKKRTDLAFLNGTTGDLGAILIEVCFCDSKPDCELLRENWDAVCKAIAKTISGEDIGDELPPERPERPERPARPERPQPQPPVDEHPELAKGDTGPAVESVQASLGLPADGDFGSVTEAGVKGFQRAWAIPGGADGVVGDNTWRALEDLDARMDAGGDGISDELAAKIDEIVSNAPVRNYNWDDRGQATLGYYQGMAKTFAVALGMLDDGDPAAQIMAAAESNEEDIDALAWYHDEFADEGMSNDESSADTLRHLFVLLTGLGMRESSGNPWEGRDMSADNVQSDTCEAGLFQSSWNLAGAADEIDDLFQEYKADPNGFQPTFAKGWSPTTANLDNYGSGDGCMYQWLAKYSPAFAVMMTAIGTRVLRQHWGPINRREVEIVSTVDDMLMDVQHAVETQVVA